MISLIPWKCNIAILQYYLVINLNKYMFHFAVIWWTNDSYYFISHNLDNLRFGELQRPSNLRPGHCESLRRKIMKRRQNIKKAKWTRLQKMQETYQSLDLPSQIPEKTSPKKVSFTCERRDSVKRHKKKIQQ